MDLPKELILEISEYAGISCYICGKNFVHGQSLDIREYIFVGMNVMFRQFFLY